MRVNIKPLSQNECWQGRRYKTKKYEIYEKSILYMLRPIQIPEGKLQIDYVFGYSNSASDIDNGIKSFQDILSKKYGFNDNRIYCITVLKQIVKKGNEFIDFHISEYKPAL